MDELVVASVRQKSVSMHVTLWPRANDLKPL